MPLPQTKPPRIQIEDVWPQLDCGRYPVKRSVGDEVEVWATIFRDGHELLGAAIRYRAPGSSQWDEIEMRKVEDQPDRWTGSFHVDRCGRWEFTIEAWVDRFESWRDELRRKVEAGQTDLASELAGGRCAAEGARARRRDRPRDDRARPLRADPARSLARGRRRPRARPLRGLVRALSALVGRVQGRREGAARARRPRLRRRLLPADPPDRQDEPQGPEQLARGGEGRPGQPMGDRRRRRAATPPSIPSSGRSTISTAWSPARASSGSRSRSTSRSSARPTTPG